MTLVISLVCIAPLSWSEPVGFPSVVGANAAILSTRSRMVEGRVPLHDEDTWRFGAQGYFRAPRRIGSGRRDGVAKGQASTTLHAPLVRADQYLSWQHTNHSRREWAELFFSYGNRWAKGTLAIQGFNFTDASVVATHATGQPTREHQTMTVLGLDTRFVEVQCV